MVTILIPELIPAHNKGEEAIFWGILETLQFLPEKKVYLYSKHPEYDARTFKDSAILITESLIPEHYDPKSKKILRLLNQIPRHALFGVLYRIHKGLARALFRGGLWRAYDECDFVILGHDSGYTTTHNLLIPFLKFIGKTVVVYGASITPSFHRKEWVKRLTRFALDRADLVTTREEISSKIMTEGIGVKAELVHLTGDKAFLLKPAEQERGVELLEKHGVHYGRDTIIGMTVVHKTGMAIMSSQKFDMDGADSQRFDSDRHVDVMARFVDYVVEQTGAKIVFFPHCIGPTEGHDDRIGAARVCERCTHKDNLFPITEDLPGAELKSMIGCCDFFVGERTHSVIGAASMRVPCVVISQPDDYRTIGILGRMVGMEEWIYNIKSLDLDSLKQFFSHAWASREAIRALLNERIPIVVQNSMSNGVLLEAVLRKRGILPC